MVWEMWAKRWVGANDDPTRVWYSDFTFEKEKLRLIYGRSPEAEAKWAKVQLTEVPNSIAAKSDYYGWIETGKDQPCMIQNHRIKYNMQFTYGPKVEEEHGRGKTVRLAIVEMSTHYLETDVAEELLDQLIQLRRVDLYLGTHGVKIIKNHFKSWCRHPSNRTKYSTLVEAFLTYSKDTFDYGEWSAKYQSIMDEDYDFNEEEPK